MVHRYGRRLGITHAVAAAETGNPDLKERPFRRVSTERT
jgi:hypothetical protein